MNLYSFQLSTKPGENGVSPVVTLVIIYTITLIVTLFWTALLITILYYKSAPNKSNPIIYIFSCLLGDSLPQILKQHCQLLNIFNVNDKLIKPKLSNEKFALKIISNKESQNKLISIYRPTLKILIKNSSGQSAVARALLDTGSAYSYISPQLVRRINCSTRLIWPLYISRFCGQSSEIVYQTATDVKLHSIENIAVSSNCLELLIDCETDDSKRTCRAPSKNLARKLATVFGINLSDNENQDVICDLPHYDLLIGQDILHSEVLLNSMNVVKLTKDLSILKTKFGHAVMGRWNDQTEFKAPLADKLENEAFMSIPTKATINMTPVPAWIAILVVPPSTFIFMHLVFIFTIFTSLLPVLLFIHKIVLHLSKIGIVFLSLYFSLNYFLTEFFFTFISPYVKLPYKKTYKFDQIPYSYQPTVYAAIENPQYPNRCVGASILLDTGSIYSYICSSLAQQLNCKVITYGPRKAVWVKLKNLSSSTELKVLLWVHESLQFKHCPRPSSQILKMINSSEHSTVIQNDYCSFKKTFNVIIGSDLLSSVLSHSTESAQKIHLNLVAHQCRLGLVVQGANLNFANPWNVLQNKICFNLEAHFVNRRKLVSLWLFFVALLWLDLLPFYFIFK